MTQRYVAVIILAASVACAPEPSPAPATASRWKMAESSATLVPDPMLREQMYHALDAAEHAGTDPSISKFQVRCATAVSTPTGERVILGGNSEYAQAPEAIHGETSLVNHVIDELGAQASRDSLRFLAFYGERCEGGRSCGDCRDYLVSSTKYDQLLIACGQATDHTVHVQRFADEIVPESSLREVAAADIPLKPQELSSLVEAAADARNGGIALFTTPVQHLGAAALSSRGKVYSAAGADDAAFHYRTAIGGVLPQAATARDYFIRAIAVAGEMGQLPHVSYRDRQYGYEFSSFDRKTGRELIQLILVEEARRYRLSTFEDALPYAFSTGDFMPEAVDRFLKAHALTKSARTKQPSRAALHGTVDTTKGLS